MATLILSHLFSIRRRFCAFFFFSITAAGHFIPALQALPAVQTVSSKLPTLTTPASLQSLNLPLAKKFRGLAADLAFYST